jgi:hypothetical protein
MAPYRALPIILEVTKPIGSLNQRRTLAYSGIGDVDTISCLAKANVLFHDTTKIVERVGKVNKFTLQD